jgi:hypothetical protein
MNHEQSRGPEKPAAGPIEDDPLRSFVGIIADDAAPDDLARELDHYAYGVARGHKRAS